jgi:hypothetical protein
MQLLYLATFLTGLLLGVYAMIRGVERIGTPGRTPELDALGRPTGAARMALSAPTAGAFATVLGVTGYLLWRYTTLASGVQLAVAVGAALIATVAAARAVSYWATQAAEHDIVDERYLLQGHPAQVVTPILADLPGEIAYVVGGKRQGRKRRGVRRALDTGRTASLGADEMVVRQPDPLFIGWLGGRRWHNVGRGDLRSCFHLDLRAAHYRRDGRVPLDLATNR